MRDRLCTMPEKPGPVRTRLPRLTVGLMALGLAAFASAGEPAESGEGEYSLEIEVRELDCCTGELRVALYNDPESWLDADRMVRGKSVPVTAATHHVNFAGLPPGEYAVALFHDVNTNNRLDRVLGLVPKEPYGFSGNPSGMGRPSFGDARIEVPADSAVVIDVRPPPM